MYLIAQELRQKGQRFTKQRECILSALTHIPLSVSDISKSLKSKGVSIDKVTLYRNLDRFTSLGLVGKTQFKDKLSKYELLDEHKHHHHVICNICGKIEDVLLSERSLLNNAKRKTKFVIQSHSLEFFGLCAHCQ